MPPKVIEQFENWAPPYGVTRAVQRVLSFTDERHLAGISSIVLTNVEGLSKRREREARSRRQPRRGLVLARYHEAFRGSPAWIEVFMDRACDNLTKWLPAPVREFELAEILHHELGRHLHRTVAREHVNPEKAAEKWKERLIGEYIRRRYRRMGALWVPAVRLAKAVWRMCGRAPRPSNSAL